MLRLTLLLVALAAPLRAEPPRVLTDIAPVHSLVASVMSGVATPDLLLPPGIAPHDYALRPSDAARIAESDLIFWVGPGLTPWLAEGLATLAPDAERIALLDLSDTPTLPLRRNADFAAAAADGDRAGGGVDPHAWLDPRIATVWAMAIADALSAADPGNEATYRSNAALLDVGLEALSRDLGTLLGPVRGRGYIVPHDAFQYFETAFDMPATAAISASDDADPGPAHLAALRDRIAAGDIACLLTGPDPSPGLVATLAGDADLPTAATDPEGTRLAPGPDLYPTLLRDLATGLATCLSGG